MTYTREQVERFRLVVFRGKVIPTLEASPDGQYVLASDYDALLSDRDALRDQVASLTAERPECQR